MDLLLYKETAKGLIKLKGSAVDSPNKWTNKYVLFAVKSKKAKKQTKQICLFFFGENLWHVNLLSVLSDLYKEPFLYVRVFLAVYIQIG